MSSLQVNTYQNTSLNWFRARLPSVMHSRTSAIKSCRTYCATFSTSYFVSAHLPLHVWLVVAHSFMKLLKFLRKLQLAQNQPLTSSTHHHPPPKQLQGLLGHSCIDFNILLLTFKAPLCVVDSRNIETLCYASSPPPLHPPDHPPRGSGPPVWALLPGWNSSRHLDVNISAHL